MEALDPCPVLGVLINEVSDSYGRLAWTSFARAARRLGVGLVVVAGRTLASPIGNEAAFNQVYDFARNTRLDGWIGVSGPLTTFVSVEVMESFLRRFSPPVYASITVPLPAIPSAFTAAGRGIGELVEHLVRTHGRRKIGCLHGPLSQPEAPARLDAFRAGMREQGLAVDEAAILCGDFVPWTARTAVLDCLARGTEFDALVCCNDGMALGAMQALAESGLRVPEDVAVVGYDDIEEARFSEPPLSTMRQPIAEQAEWALHAVLRQLRGQSVAERIDLAPRFVARASCGCLPEAPGLSESQVTGAVARVARLLRTAQDAGNTPEALAAFRISLLRELIAAGTDDVALESWQAAFESFDRGMDRQSLLRDGGLDAAESWPRLVARMRVDREGRHRMEVERIAANLQACNQIVLSSFDPETLIERLSLGLGRVGVRRGRLVLFQRIGEGERSHSGAAAICYDIRGNARGVTLRERRLAAGESAIPRPSAPGGSMIVQPLMAEREMLGILCLENEPGIETLHEPIRIMVSTALGGSRLFLEQKMARLRLEYANDELQRMSMVDDLTGLHNRRGFLMVAAQGAIGPRSAGVAQRLFIADLDDLKAVNDRWGHAAGDWAIRAVAGVLKSALRGTDVLGRIGGDEFVFLAAVSDELSHERVLARIQEGLARVNATSGRPFAISLSLGWQDADPASPLEEILSSADRLLQENKRRREAEAGSAEEYPASSVGPV